MRNKKNPGDSEKIWEDDKGVKLKDFKPIPVRQELYSSKYLKIFGIQSAWAREPHTRGVSFAVFQRGDGKNDLLGSEIIWESRCRILSALNSTLEETGEREGERGRGWCDLFMTPVHTQLSPASVLNQSTLYTSVQPNIRVFSDTLGKRKKREKKGGLKR